ncbi:major histocompatibility complex class I-related gene protein-like [Astatotilapia calliptera]|uniref:Ig-like domain-containing protein n=1 Tax=Astatotilapia calliptera TaxID=8154 RepID=A0A3P8RGL8_ASTCA|nr:major histocompatibility complex class I-related gene protein-like [Astatotilapia calliptera]
MSILFFLFNVSRYQCLFPTVKHSLVYFITESSEVRNIPEFMAVAEVKCTEFGYCDSSKKILETRQDWVQKTLYNDKAQLDSYNELCFAILPYVFRKWISKWQQLASQSEVVNTLQMMEGCEWDENTGEVNGVIQYGYNAENLLEFDLKTMKWIALKPEADIIEQDWNANGNSAETIFLTQTCPDWLKKYLKNGNSTLLRKVLPSIFLLWKTPSSPVSCHATGFYPQRALMFWRKDGVEIHEGVDPGEILPNNDGTFQMSVGLNVSSVTPEEWKRYECVFQFSNAEDSIITNLNKTVNWQKNKIRHDQKILIIAAAVVLVVIIVAVTVIAIHKMKEGRCPSSSPHNTIELSERPHRQTEESTQC